MNKWGDKEFIWGGDENMYESKKKGKDVITVA
jgi:hypothetical protein